MKTDRSGSLVLIFILALVGIALVLLITKDNVSITPDSRYYLYAAQSLLDKKGLLAPLPDGGETLLTHFPPLYPIALAFAGLSGVELLEAARWLSGIIFFANIISIGFVAKKYMPESIWIPVICSWFVLISSVMLHIHYNVWTEPLFIFLGFWGLYFLGRYLDNTAGRSTLFLGAAFMSLALLTRYIGITLVIAALLSILLLGNRSRRSLIDAIILSAISLGPFILWLIRNSLSAHTLTNRYIAFHPFTYAHGMQTLYTFSQWLLPDDIPNPTRIFLWFGILLYAIFFVTLIWKERKNATNIRRRKNRPESPAFFKISSLFVVVYYGFLVVSISFFDRHTPMNALILSPVYFVILLIMMNIIYKQNNLKGKTAIAGFIIFSLAYISSNIVSHIDPNLLF